MAKAYDVPAAERYRKRTAQNGQLAAELDAWQKSISKSWKMIRFGNSRAENQDQQWKIECEVFLDLIAPDSVEIEIFADSPDGAMPFRQTMQVIKSSSEGQYLYEGNIPSSRPVEHYSLRIIPAHRGAVIPIEDNHILWKHPI